MRADLYIRVSTDEQAEKGYSQRDQEERLRKYCAYKNIQIRDVIYEDFSAKTFQRPAWKKILESYRSKRGQVQQILFTKWDRFSRNAADAFQMINLLRKLGVEPCAIEQPLDLDIPENKIMLGIYLTSPEVENDRRAINVRNGMRRAVKEGRYMNGAPIGYINRTTPEGKKYIAVDPPKAEIIKWAFETIVNRQLHIEEVYRLAKEKGLSCGKNHFWNVLRNPAYYGKIFLRGYKDEPDCIVKGNHDPIISEKLFIDVQDRLNGGKRVRKTSEETPERFFLRGYLECPRCRKSLTASSSKGRSSYSHYYHCNSKCGIRFKALEVNEKFNSELKKFIPKPGMADIYAEVVNDLFKKNSSSNNIEIQKLNTRVSELQDQINKARGKFIIDEIDKTDYHEVRKGCETEIERLEAEIFELSKKRINISNQIRKAIHNLSNLNEIFENGTVSNRRKVVGSIFPEKLVFEGLNFRTTKVNEAVQLIFNMGEGFGEKKSGQTDEKIDLSTWVIRIGFEPMTYCLEGSCSIQLSYRTSFGGAK